MKKQIAYKKICLRSDKMDINSLIKFLSIIKKKYTKTYEDEPYSQCINVVFGDGEGWVEIKEFVHEK